MPAEPEPLSCACPECKPEPGLKSFTGTVALTGAFTECVTLTDRIPEPGINTITYTFSRRRSLP